jgi:hypothetical protein
MASPVGLPEGFIVDQPKQAQGLPEGFVINEPINEAPKEKGGFFSDLADMASKDPIIGGAENLLSFLTGAAAEPISGYVGMAAGPDAVGATQKALTYQPRSESGKQIQEGVGEALAPVGEAITGAEDFLGGAALEATGSPAVAAAAATIPTAAMELLGLKGARKAKRAAPRNITPETPPSLPETGIRATAGEAAQDLASQKAENFLMEQASEGGEQLRGYKLAQSRELKDYLEGIAPEQIDNVGDSVKQALDLRENSVRFKRKQAYDKLAELTKDTDVRLNTDVIKESMPTPRELRTFERSMPSQFSAIDGLLNEFGFDLTDDGIKKAAKGGYDIEPLSVSNVEEFRQGLNAIEKADQTGATKVITGPIKNSLDGEFDLASKALQEGGSPDVARAAKEARQSHAALKTEFDEKGLTKQLTDTKAGQSRLPKIEESQVYNKLIAKSTPIEGFDRVVKSLDRAASKGKRAKNQIKSQMIMDLMDSGFSAKSRKVNGEQIFGANAFARRFDDMEPKLKSIMSDAEFNKLKKLRKDSSDLIPPSGALPKGSAGFFIEALDKAGLMGLMNSIPYAGAASAEFLKKIGRTSQDAKAFEKAVKSSKEVKDAVNLLSTDYPSLAVALGIPLLREDEEE